MSNQWSKIQNSTWPTRFKLNLVLCHTSYRRVTKPTVKCVCEIVSDLLILEILTNAILRYDYTLSDYCNQVPKLMYQAQTLSLQRGMNDLSNELLHCLERKEKYFSKSSEKTFDLEFLKTKSLRFFNKIHFYTLLNTYMKWKDICHQEGSCKCIKLIFTSSVISFMDSTRSNHQSSDKCKSWLLKSPSSNVPFPCVVIQCCTNSKEKE